MSTSSRGFGSQSLLTIAALVVIVAGLRQADTLLPPFLVAVLLSVLVAPVVLWLEERRLPAPVAVTIALVFVFAALAAFGALLTTAFAGYEEALPGYRTAMADRSDSILAWSRGHGLQIELSQLADVLQPERFLELSMNFLGGLVGAASNTALVLLTMMFVLLEATTFPKKIRIAIDDPGDDLGQWKSMLVEIQRYLAIKTIVSLVTGATVTLLLWALGVDFPLLWGMVAFLLNYIPTVGSIIASIPAVLTAMIQPDLGIGVAALVAFGYVVINTLFGSIIEPQLMGRRLGLSPLVVFVSLAFWLWVWGPMGGLLSVPLTIVVRLVLERSEELHWVSVLLGSSSEPEVAPPSPRRKVLAKVRLPKGVPPESILRTDALDRVRIEEGDPSASMAQGAVEQSRDDLSTDEAPPDLV
ncbi:MAG: AI-2E family transporter [Nannocystaceae bacterium]|nr:AI-2E family transporter [Nannocystaceae bacterium]